MKSKKIISIFLVLTLIFALTACGSKSKDGEKDAGSSSGTSGDSNGGDSKGEDSDSGNADNSGDTTLPTYDSIKLGEDYKDITATIKFLTHRTDIVDTVLKGYVEEFNKVYPNITVEYEGITDYAETSLLRLSSKDWGDILMIPAVDKKDLSTYFVSFGDYETLDQLINFANSWEYGGQVYGIPSTGNAQGIIYNKKVFEQAGITSTPKTPEEFLAALKAISEKTDACPLYTNYFAGWTMGAWDAYLGGSATGKATFMNQELIHTAKPFADPGNGTGAYNVYKILYEAVANGYTEDDYSTTDWEGCKPMINNGEIATMVLGSWAVVQMQEAGDNAADIGYMPFPITIDGKQYASAGGDYSYGINVHASTDNQIASMVFVKWLTEDSNFSFDQGGIPIMKGGEYPATLADFDGVEMVSDLSAIPGEENFLNDINAESGLNINNGGDKKVQEIIEHAFNGTKTFDEIMNDWNQAWGDALTTLNIETKY